MPQPASTAATVPPQPQVEGDLSSYIEARRRARGQVAAPQDRPTQSESLPAPRSEDDKERSKRIIAAAFDAAQEAGKAQSGKYWPPLFSRDSQARYSGTRCQLVRTICSDQSSDPFSF